ncbi:MAG: DUF2079 domain-containing protein [Candidatus Baltobacteraceae bacterium]
MKKWLPWAIAAGYTLLFAVLGAWRYAVHRNLVDFGIFAQSLRTSFFCLCNPIEGSHWAFHFSPILALPMLLLHLWNSPLVLVIIQTSACALAIPAVYAIVKRHSDARTAATAAWIAALYPPLAGLAFVDFHENVFAPAAVLWLFWALDARRFRIAAAFAVLALAVKEDQALFIGFAAFAAAWWLRADTAMRRFLVGLGTLAVAVAALFFLVIAPHAGSNPAWQPTRFYAWNASDFAALPGTLVERIGFLVLAFAPLAFVPLRSPLIVFAIPPFAEVLLSRMPTTFTMGTHYAGAWIGYLLAAFAFTVPRVSRRTLYVALALCILEFAVADPLHPALNLRPIEARDRALDAYLARWPADLAVATQEEAYGHLALRVARATLLPDDGTAPLPSDIVLIDRAFAHSPRLQENAARLAALEAKGTLHIAVTCGKILVMTVGPKAPAAAIPRCPRASR